MLAGRVSLATTPVLALTGYGWASYHGFVSGLRTSGVLNGASTSAGGDTDILIMGRDSWLDETPNKPSRSCASTGGYVHSSLSVPAGHVRIVLETDYPSSGGWAASGGLPAGGATASPDPSTPDTSGGLSALSGGGIPCVK